MASEPATKAPNARVEPTPDHTRARVLIARSSRTKRVYQKDPETGRISVLAGTLDFLLRIAYGVHPRDIVYEVRLDRKARYDVDVIPPDNDPNAATALMRKHLGPTLGFEASLESRVVSVNIIRRMEGAPPLRASNAKKKSVIGGKGRLTGTAASMNDLARFTRTLTPEPVVDETELEGGYDFILEWDPSAGDHALRQAFADLGLELVQGEREVELLIVRAPSPAKPERTGKLGPGSEASNG